MTPESVEKAVPRTFTFHVTVPKWVATYLHECSTNAQYKWTLIAGCVWILTLASAALFFGSLYILGIELPTR